MGLAGRVGGRGVRDGQSTLSLIVSNDFEDPILYREARSVICSDQNEKLKLSVSDFEKLDADRQVGASKEQASQSVVLKELFRVKPALSLHTMVVLQAYKADLLKELDYGEGSALEAVKEATYLGLCSMTGKRTQAQSSRGRQDLRSVITSRMAKNVLTLMGPGH